MRSTASSLTIAVLSITYAQTALAADGHQNPLWRDVVVALFPLLLFGLVMYFVIKLAQRKVNSINERIIESNERIAASLERIAALLEDKFKR